jgi:hypothetical protein
MNTLKQIVMQEANEERFSRKFIDGYISEDIRDNPETQAMIQHGVELLEKYAEGDYYASKMKRIAQLNGLDFETLVTDIFVGICYCQREEQFSSVAAQMASRLKFSDRVEAVTTVAEILATLCLTDAFDILKATKSSSLVIVSRIKLTKKTKDFVAHSLYLPPMVCQPQKLTSNYSSAYLTHNDSLILGQNNHHSGDICLDVLNLMNAVPLKLNTEFLSSVEEEPTFERDTQAQIDLWSDFKKQSYSFYSLIVNQGNEFYLTHKVDKRGRIYSCGYHINTQGTPFKKACIELSQEELITGVP